MISKKIKSSAVEKSDASNYMKRAKELIESMRNNLIMENWNAAVIDGVHAAISANDAVIVSIAGKRCTSSHHIDAVELLKQSLSKDMLPDLIRLRRIINIKSHVEYGPSLVTAKEAQRVAQDAERLITWAEKFF
ncbi:MAG: HEPN domain-containing protein [Pseudomonadota bacterium]